MSEVKLTADSGRTVGSRSSGRLRGEGKIPAVVYGHGIAPLSVSIDRKALRAALHTDAGHNALINLETAGGSHLTIVKDLQRHPVRNEVVHVDFLVVNRDEVVTIDTPILLEGESAAVKAANGTIDQQLFTLTVNAKPADIPNDITVDVSGMDIGDAIRVGDLQLPAGVTTDVDPEEAIATAQVTRATIEAEELEAEAAEGEGGETAEGEAGEAGEAAEGEATEGDAEEASE